jgi:large subunit ribosomal protein L30
VSPADSTPEGASPDSTAPAEGAAEEPVKKAAPSKAPSTRKAAGSAKKAAGTAKAPAKASAPTKAASTKAAAPTKAASAQAQAPAGEAASGQATGSTKLSPTTTKTPAPTATAWLRVTQVRSAIGTKPKHRGTLGALGLRGIGRTNLLPDRPEIRGMLARVPHLVEVASVDYDQKG